MPEFNTKLWAILLAKQFEKENLIKGLTNNMNSDRIKGVKKIRFDLPIHLTLMVGGVKFIKETPGLPHPYLLQVVATRYDQHSDKTYYHEFLVSVDEYGFAHDQAI